jgi:hypothetical protein
VLALNRAESVTQKPTTVVDWFNRLCDCDSPNARKDVYDLLLEDHRKNLHQLFEHRQDEVVILRRFRDVHPAFFSKVSFTNIKARGYLHLPLVSVVSVTQNSS